MGKNFKIKLFIPVMILMLVPLIIMSIYFSLNFINIIDNSAEKNIHNSLNTILINIDPSDQISLQKHKLLTGISSMNYFGIIVYQGNERIYEKRDEVNQDFFSKDIREIKSKRYYVKQKNFQDLGLEVFFIVDRFQNIFRLFQEQISYIIFILLATIVVSIGLLLLIATIIKPIGIFLEGYNNLISGNTSEKFQLNDGQGLILLGNEFKLIKNQIHTRTNEFLKMKELNENILRSITIGIIHGDMEGKIENYNNVAWEIIEKVSDSHNQEVKIIKDIIIQFHKTIEDKIIINQILEFYSANQKETIYLEVTTSLMKNCKGEYVGVICSLNDISDRKKVENNLERINRLTSLGQLTAGLAHEIRNPLSGIRMSTQIFNKRFNGYFNERAQKLIEGTLEEVDRLDLLISDLLKFASYRKPEKKQVKINDVLERALLFLDKKITEKEIIVDIKSYVSEPRAYVDKGQLSQIFLNIISNAINALSTHGKLEISIEKVKEEILINFEDNGKGIRKEDLKKVYDPFFTTEKSGTGLGLAVVHKLLEANNGDIHIESRENLGTIVKMFLPVVEEGDNYDNEYISN